jgi:RNA polymerase sigma factor (sigma-70 family)
VLQDVFLRAYNTLRADGRPLTLRAWLYRVAHNRCIDQLRRPIPAAADIFDLNRAPEHDPTDAAERRENLRRLVEDVRRLPEQQRSALLMREMEGLSYTELAEALGVTVPAIKSLLVRARIGLVEAIEARDTACGEIRTDLASAFDRGVRASGRSRKHLRECAACRDYRSALRRVEKQLNGLSPGSGPLAALAKILGVGGAGSGAAAGGSAMAGGGAVTIGGGAATATAGKVVAVVAAAAVVGGGAATVEHRVQHHKPAPKVVVAPAPSPAATRGLTHRAAAASVVPATRHHVASRTHASVAHLDPEPVAATTAENMPQTYERMTGGLQAPDDTAPAADPTATAPPRVAPDTVTPAAGDKPGAAQAPGAAGPSGSTTATTTPAGGAASTGTGGAAPTGTGGSPSPATAAGSSSSSTPGGQVAPTASGAPVAQGAAANPGGTGAR